MPRPVASGPVDRTRRTSAAAETLRVTLGHEIHGSDGTICGLMLLGLIIDMPKGILGKILELWSRRGGASPPGRLRPASEAAE